MAACVHSKPRPLTGDRPRRIRRQPETTAINQIVTAHLDDFLRATRTGPDAHGIPTYVERELRAFTTCGVPEAGFVRLRCQSCGADDIVAFSCKARTICPSCAGRRMNDTAAWLTSALLPDVPYRQWVLTFPFRMRLVLASDPKLISGALIIAIRALRTWYARRAGRPAANIGAVTSIQYFGSALQLTPHLHILMTDGVFETTGGDDDAEKKEATFHPVDPPAGHEVAELVARIRRRVCRMLRRRGCIDDEEQLTDQATILHLDEPVLTHTRAASLTGRIAFGPRAGQRVERLGATLLRPVVDIVAPRCADSGGFNLHANTTVDAGDRSALESMLRYLFRPAVAQDAVTLRDDGKVMLRLKRPFSDGTTHFIFDPVDFIARLAALVPPPRSHLARYHGLLGPNHHARAAIVRLVPAPDPAPTPTSTLPAPPEPATPPTPPEVPSEPAAPPATAVPPERATPPTRTRTRTRRKFTWAQLMLRVFEIDVLECEVCGGRRKLIAAITNPTSARRFLESWQRDSPTPSTRAPPHAAATNAAAA